MAKYLPVARKRVETADSPFWISYADLMTALVMLFLVVMSISMVAIASRQMVEKKARDTQVEEILEEMDQEARQQGLEVRVDRVNHTISFGEQVRFAHDSFKLSPEAKEKLQAFVPVLLEVHSREKAGRWLKRVHIEGYTDETGTYLYNVNLSLNRAQAVVCTFFDADLTPEMRRQLRSILIIDGATVTGIKASREESRRVEVRLEFRQLDDEEAPLPVPEMPLGRCPIPVDVVTEGGTPPPAPQVAPKSVPPAG